ncbi:MAG TPA: OsmC family protein [Candidatus Dormibacteraeota bacterium]
MQKAVAVWQGKARDSGAPITTFEVQAGSGHTALVDEPPVFGDDLGMRPTEMLLGALGACTGVNAVLLLRKYKQPFRSLQVEVEGDQQPDWPHAFTQIRITFAIEWDGKFDGKLVDEALDQACNKYCPVDATLTHGTKIAVDRRDTKPPR